MELFSAAASAGLQPREVLDLTLWEVNAVLIGYNNHLISLRCIAVEQGYYSAYYTNARHAKSVDKIISQLQKGIQSGLKQTKNIATTTAPNIDAFLALDQIFREEKANAG